MVTIFRSAKQKGQEAAKAIAKRAKEEVLEYPKHVGAQLTKTEAHKPTQSISPIVEAMQQGTQKVTDAEHVGIHKGEKRQLDYLQKEMEELRKKREMENEQARARELQEQQRVAEQIAEQKTLLMPSSRPSRRMAAAGKQKQSKGVGEMLKSQK